MEDSLDRQYMLSFLTNDKNKKEPFMSENLQVILLIATVIASIFWLLTYERPHTQSYQDYQNQQVQDAMDDLPY